MPPAPDIAREVRSYTLPPPPPGEDLFAELSASVHWEDVGKGRRGAVLTRVDEDGRVPLVRTTTRYAAPAQRFRDVHERLAVRIQEHAEIPVAFNNALIETYTNAYTTMGAHSDQALDLAEDSFIAVFSCYRRPDAGPPRKLIFHPKGSEGERFEVPLVHNGFVVFSVGSNRRLKHKIVLEKPVPPTDNQWLGVTFRTSRTLLEFRDGHAHLPRGPHLPRDPHHRHGPRLTMADEEQSQEFYRLRRRENNEIDFIYPPLTYTVSESDLLPPV